jgi:hypothetical protein
MSCWRQLQSDIHDSQQPAHTHIRCDPTFHNTFGDLPCWINPSTTLRLVTQNVQGIKPIANDDKLQSGIANMVALCTLLQLSKS